MKMDKIPTCDGVGWLDTDKLPFGSEDDLIFEFDGTRLYVHWSVYEEFHHKVEYELIGSDDPRLAFAKQFESRGKYWPDVHPTAVLGGKPGFGFARDKDGSLIRMPHIGTIILGKSVEIGAYTCIDKGCLTDTVIGDGTKIDNLVHVAHGVVIGKDCWIAAGAVLGGSARLGDCVEVGINASILPHVSVGDRARIGAGAVVTKNVPPNQTWAGNPAKEL